ncbi:MAG: MoaD/ThiS family protein [Candidatus Thermoplasmatota archaeon]|nr:MoaD/ThiS family protein [Candidatus Thermoplasmatota archaeon]
MKIIVRVFGRYKDIVGADSMQFDITDGKTIQDVVDFFVRRYPVVDKDKNRIMVIKNKMYISFDSTITEGDEIALSPPVVSGG